MKKYLLFISIFNILVACKQNIKLTPKEKQTYTQKGKKIAQATFKELSGNLMAQMKSGGITQAVPFCNVQAMPLTNKISETHNVSIKRASDKYRNILNKPTDRELEIIKQFKQLNTEKKEIKPVVEIGKDAKKHFYAPIKINQKCLGCHGQVSPKTDSIISIHYPNDLAQGYKEGDLRGIWSITFNK